MRISLLPTTTTTDTNNDIGAPYREHNNGTERSVIKQIVLKTCVKHHNKAKQGKQQRNTTRQNTPKTTPKQQYKNYHYLSIIYARKHGFIQLCKNGFQLAPVLYSTFLPVNRASTSTARHRGRGPLPRIEAHAPARGFVLVLCPLCARDQSTDQESN